MATAQAPAQQSSASNTTQAPTQSPSTSAPPPAVPATGSAEPPPNPFSALGQEQIATILKTLGPSFYQAARPGGDPKDSALAAETLSNMAQAGFPHLPPGVPYQHYPQLSALEPGPSSHPRGPPSLAGMAAGSPEGHSQQNGEGSPESPGSPGDQDKPKSASGRRTGRNATMTNDEWARQRKDNHKEVERRRRGNINEGINELGRIVPNGSGEKAKGAILSRAVQYIHHLKENEARNIEKWTLEKLLMDQAMGDLQAQLEEVRRAWDEERAARQRVENEVAVLRGIHGQHAGQSAPGQSDPTPASRPGSTEGRTSPKRTLEEDKSANADEGDGRAKRQRVE